MNQKIIESICKGIRASVDIAVVGLSGGADSTLVACLCTRALGCENVYGAGMPYNEFDKETFNSRSASLGSKLGINYHEVSISKIADAVDEVVAGSGFEVSTLNSGNSRSRARMCVLYSFAHSLATKFAGKKVRVMGTGNLSEDFIGYDTKGGDALADIFPIGELYKSEVYQCLDLFVAEGLIDDCHIDRVPSAGLESGQTDEGDLGFSYDKMQNGIIYCRKYYDEMDEKIKQGGVDEVTKFVWTRHLANKHKHEAPPVLALRDMLDE